MSLTWLRSFLSFFDKRFIALFITECTGEPQNVRVYTSKAEKEQKGLRGESAFLSSSMIARVEVLLYKLLVVFTPDTVFFPKLGSF